MAARARTPATVKQRPQRSRRAHPDRARSAPAARSLRGRSSLPGRHLECRFARAPHLEERRPQRGLGQSVTHILREGMHRQQHQKRVMSVGDEPRGDFDDLTVSIACSGEAACSRWRSASCHRTIWSPSTMATNSSVEVKYSYADVLESPPGRRQPSW